jgi:hypothetical protein
MSFAELSHCSIHVFQSPSTQSLLSNIPEASASLRPIPDPLATTSMQPTTDAPVVASPEQPLPPHNQPPPARYQDLLPQPLLPMIDPQPTSSSSVIPRVFIHVFDSFWTQFNKFGIVHAYRHCPSHDPDSFLNVDELSRSCEPIVPNPAEGCRDYSPPWPWSNMSIWHLMTWKETGSNLKSNSEVTWLVHDVLQALDFDIQDLSLFNTSRHTSQIDATQKVIPPDVVFGIDGWKHTMVEISVPTKEKKKEGNGRTFSVDGLQYRPILNVVRAVFAEASSKSFHLMPFKKIWKSPITGHQQRVYDELYVSDTWNEAQDDIKQRRVHGCKLERVIAGLMFWSNLTRLAQFGHTSAWPVYLFFGNLSKYAHANPQSGCCHPIAFIPSVSFLVFSFFLPSTFLDVH